uniref:Ferric-chelate reductase 1 n=1 Tax=Syphacia muris TaxID=451379 RepID=A0A0N5AHJ0_9BILA
MIALKDNHRIFTLKLSKSYLLILLTVHLSSQQQLPATRRDRCESQTRTVATTFNLDGCGENKGCWFHPPRCEAQQIDACNSSVKWQLLDDGILFEMQAVTTDLNPTTGHYVALGFSKDTRMGDDSVIECISGADGLSKAYLSFNDETSNSQLVQATTIVLSNATINASNGHLSCSVKWNLSKLNEVPAADQYKVFDIKARPWHLLFARGDTERYSLAKQMHSVNDGYRFPWISKQMVNLSSENSLVLLTKMKQTDLSRYWRYRFAVMHGSFLLLAWWVLASPAILLARYFKPVWSEKKLLGTAVWFQLHRDLNILSVIIQAVAVFLIIYQAGRLYQCSYSCPLEDWYKKMHVITGIGAMGFVLLQPVSALFRPGPNSPRRPIFNWIHWFFGMLSWTLASVTILLSVPLGKTGLMANYGHTPTWIMASYITVFLLSCVFLEILSSTASRRTEKLGPTGMALSVINGPSTESPVAVSTYSTLRLIILVIHWICALGVSITITVMLVKILLSHSP